MPAILIEDVAKRQDESWYVLWSWLEWYRWSSWDLSFRNCYLRLAHALWTSVESDFLNLKGKRILVRVIRRFEEIESSKGPRNRDSTVLHLVRIKNTKFLIESQKTVSGWNSCKAFKPGFSWVHLTLTLSPLSLRTTTACSAFKSRGPTSIRSGTPWTEMKINTANVKN